jgi:hypothetical protein
MANDSRDEVTLGYLKGTGQDIVELILLLCRRGATFDDLMQVMPFLSSPELLKKYLFYLIDYDLILYSERERVYMIKDIGFEVLFRIGRENSQIITKYKDNE